MQERTAQGLVIQILRAAQLKPKLRANMGVNFPQSKLPLPAVGEDDTENIRKLAPLVDAFSLSFVHQPEEVAFAIPFDVAPSANYPPLRFTSCDERSLKCTAKTLESY